MKTATFGAGCFWGVEYSFGKLNGVIKTEVGYEGGILDSPTYKDVCTNTTGHAEVCKITFDEKIISYEELLKHFFEIHNPTTLNKQGPDVGTQYRSVVFYNDDFQKESAVEMIQKLNQSNIFKDPIVTEVSPSKVFYKAEEYHQQYVLKTGDHSCHI